MPKGFREDGTPNGKGYPHGGNGQSAEQIAQKQKIYAETLARGETAKKAKELAGYSEGTNPVHRPPGGEVDKAIKQTLEDHGITDDFLANEYLDGLKRSKEPGAKDAAFSAHAQYLKQLGYLRGHRKDLPQVAVQINNQPASTGELNPERIKAIVGLLETEIAARQSDGVHDENPGTPSPQACEGVVEPPGNSEPTGDRGQP